MPRRNRVHFQHAFYHVMLRGNYQQSIFTNDEDRLKLLSLLRQATEVQGCKIHLFCLMTNHIHLVVEVVDIPLSKIMQSIFSCYVRYFNQRIRKIGRLFQDRYKAKLISNDDYLMELCFYIHKNPVTANMCKNFNDYSWSSHLVYAGINKISWVTTEQIHSLLRNHVDVKKNHYHVFMLDKDNVYSKPAFCHLDENGILIIEDSVSSKASQGSFLALENVPIKVIVNVICGHLGVPVAALTSSSQQRTVVLARVIVAYFAHYYAKYFLKDIAALFDLAPDSLSKSVNRFLKKSQSDKYLQDLMRIIEGKLSACDPERLIL